MTIFSLVTELRAMGVELSQDNGKLNLRAPKGVLTDDLREKLVKNKLEIIAFLEEISVSSKTPPIQSISRVGSGLVDGSPIPLSFSQERLWFIDQLEPNSAHYSIPGAVIFKEELSVDLIEEAFGIIIARHENLRTVFPSKEGQAQQVILDCINFRLKRFDLTDEKSPKIRHQKAQRICQNEAETPFDLANGPLIRGELIKLSGAEQSQEPQEYILMFNMHHIISDGWSMGVMIAEFDLIMDRLRQGRFSKLPPLAIQYRDYSIWQRKLLSEGGVLEHQLSYWEKKLTGTPESLNLVTDYPRPAVQSVTGSKQSFALSAQLAGELKRIAEQQGCTLFMTLLAAFKVLLYRYTGQEDICIGTPIANRQYEETEKLIGMFVNTLALRSQLDSEAPFTSFLAQVKTTCIEAYEHQDTPFEKIVDLIQSGRNLAISPLFQIMFVVENATTGSTEQQFRPYPLERNLSKFDLTLTFTETQEGLEGEIEYCTALFSSRTIERLTRHLVTLFEAIASSPTECINKLDFIGEEERHHLLVELNKTQADYPRDKCIHELFIEQVAINPDKIALVYQDDTLSYQQLYEKSHALALYLQSLGVQPDSLIGLCVERSLAMMIGMLGILQAGAAYVPLDPEYPDDRLAYMLNDSSAGIVLTQEKLHGKLSPLVPENVQLITLDSQWSEISERATDLHARHVGLRQEVNAQNLAYVIYTSGSTGQPKGVMVDHKAVNRLVINSNFVDVKADDVFLQFASISFDAATFEIWGALLNGAKLAIAPHGVSAIDRVEELVQIYDVSILWLATGLFQLLVNGNVDKLSKIRVLLSGGDVVPVETTRKFLEGCKDSTFVNGYGPTENTTFTTCYVLNKGLNDDLTSLPIGSPIANTQVYVLDQHNNPQPIGVPGELCIGGDGLARGYLNRPELTEVKFVPNPFNPGTRLYKSGDLVRWNSEGNIEFLGRIDTQVKIRGYRIELGEIEFQLNQYPEIQTSVVIAKEHKGDKQLIAYHVAEGIEENSHSKFTQEDLRAYLKRSLPEYMVPTAFVSLTAIPLTSNGKVDRRALERLEVGIQSSQAYRSPRNEIERQLLAIWASVLKLNPESIGTNDNFFELGGHSLLATQLISRVRSLFAIELPLKALFEQPNITGLASLVVKAERSKVPPIVSVKRIDADGLPIESLPLSFAQERLWFIDQLEPHSVDYNVPLVVTISDELDIDCLDRAFNLIISRHENLRTTFPSQDGKAQQQILEHLDFKLERFDLSDYTCNETRSKAARELCETEAATPFNLAKGPLIRGRLIKIAAQEHLLMLTMHHIVSDGWSMGVMIGEFGLIMNKLRQGQTPDLPPLPIQYLDYSIWQRSLLEEGGVLERQLAYWHDKLAGAPESLNLATDYPRPNVQSSAGDRRILRLDSSLTCQLKDLAEEQGCTLFMTLMAAFKVLLYRYTGQEDICLGSPIANRQYEETESLIGMFVNTLALRNQLEGEMRFSTFLAEVKKTCLEAYEHQDAPFEKIVELVQPGRNLAISPLFQVMFILQNTPVESSEQRIKPYPIESNVSKFDLTVTFAESVEGLEGVITYRTALFRPETIERMAQNFKILCQAITTTPDAKISDLDFFSEAEKQTLLVGFNDTQAVYPKDKCIHQLFNEQVALHPDRIAVVSKEERLTYQKLYEKSRTLALYLQSLGVEPDSLVGLCVDRSLDMVVAILGIMQAGGAYVPLDPDLPDDRLAYMLKDSQATIVLTQKNLQEKLNNLITKDAQTMALDHQWPEISDCVSRLKTQKVTLQKNARAHHLAYVIYTSGSTGQPKGVMVEHRMVIDYCHSVNRKMELDQCETFASLSTFSADLGNTMLFVPLIFNKTIHLFSNSYVRDPIKLKHYLSVQPIDCMKITPSHFEMFKISDVEIVASSKVMIFAGEPLTKEIVETVKTLMPGCRVFNNYGPTETTIAKLSTTDLTSADVSSVHLGKPLANTQIYILDLNNQPQPIGVPGELHIAGDGVARGYFNRPELTEERFVPNPFTPGTRLYKSGDLARWRSDGNIEYLGRIDTQVKIRGFRIETGEIEAQLNRSPRIKSSVVVAQGHEPNKQLIAYYVSTNAKNDQDVSLVDGDFRAFLQQTLPDYMVPAAFVSLETIPMTPNKKIDRRALEQLDVSLESAQAYLAPSSEMELQLVAIWGEVLNIEPEKIGVNDNFFELGGHSLLAVRLMAKINAQFKQLLPLATLFSAPSIAALAKLIASNESSSVEILVPIQTKGNKLAIFAVPGVGGNVLSFQPLSRALGNAHPFYGLQAVGLDGTSAPFESVEETAKANVAALQTIQSTGPYQIVGHSYGGVVAFEMVRILLEQNEEIASLILLDSFASSVIQEQDEIDEADRLFENLVVLESLHGLNLNLNIEQLREMSKDKRNEYISTIFSRHQIEMTEEQFTTFSRVFEANRSCYRSYKPTMLPHKVNVSLYRATKRHQDRRITPSDYGWSQLLINPINIFDVEADHFSMLEEGNVQHIVVNTS